MTLIDPLVQLVYASRPFGYDDAMLRGILLDARRCNQRDGITGALVCRGDVYLQLLEGPKSKVEAAYARIRRDDRHVEPKELVNRPVRSRIFPEWAMLHDPAQSWFWSAQELADGALERASLDEIVTLFEDLAQRAEAG